MHNHQYIYHKRYKNEKTNTHKIFLQKIIAIYHNNQIQRFCGSFTAKPCYSLAQHDTHSGIILCMQWEMTIQAIPSLIGWGHTLNYPCILHKMAMANIALIPQKKLKDMSSYGVPSMFLRIITCCFVSISQNICFCWLENKGLNESGLRSFGHRKKLLIYMQGWRRYIENVNGCSSLN